MESGMQLGQERAEELRKELDAVRDRLHSVTFQLRCADELLNLYAEKAHCEGCKVAPNETCPGNAEKANEYFRRFYPGTA